MLMARPVSVQIIAWETPLAMARASAEPRSAIESKTSSMPLTVPTRPSSGESGTSTLRSSSLAFISLLRREIRNIRICRAHQERCSSRARHSRLVASTCAGSTREKYQNRSITSVHITKPHRKMKKTKGPPSPTRSETAPIGQSSASTTIVSGALSLEAGGEQPGALLIEDLDHVARQRCEPGVDEEQRDRDPEAEHGGDH